ncbi:MAG: potassium transporter TrkA [candidate division Zixibacteria bacterium]|nr:potassium transporter TrkA [candidate division Zixibacteria bacterium]
MLGIVGILALLTVLGLSLIITRIASTALALTGLSYETARFQARSAFTGTGFTTNEAENIVNHPVRRRIIMLLMIFRSAGLITIVISLILTFVNTGDQSVRLVRLLFLIGGVIVFLILSRSRIVDIYLRHLINKALNRWTDLDTRDYYNLLHLSDEYVVTELRVEEGDWLVDKDLRECNLNAEGVIILGIQRHEGIFIGAPAGKTKINIQDTLLIYGKSDAIKNLDKRRNDFEGDEAHRKAVDEHEKEKRKQDAIDREKEKVL